jgi:predicted N-formylglutamate amidohydrolase
MAKLKESLTSTESAAQVENIKGSSQIVLVCEHASWQLPGFIDTLGLDEETMLSPYAWDPGAASLASMMSEILDAPLVLQRYTRLVYDCNRCFEALDVIVSEADDLVIPGNADLSKEIQQQRYNVIYQPFEDAIKAIIATHQEQGIKSVIVTVHSFMPIYKGQKRSVQFGILHDSDSRLADALLLLAEPDDSLRVARNEPYSAKDGVTHTLKTHGINNGLLNVMFEVSNDLIANNDSQRHWADYLSGLLVKALDSER